MTTEASTITARSGDSLRLNITAKDSDGSPLDLTGGQVRFGLGKSPTGSAEVVKSSSEGSVAITDAAVGEFVVEIEPADSADLSGMYHFEVEVTEAGGVVSTVLVGQLMFKGDMLA